MTRILVTGAAGMIGSKLVRRLVRDNHEVHGCDSYTPYYDVRLKQARAGHVKSETGIAIETLDICDLSALDRFFKSVEPEVVINLAAQPGVRQGLEHPAAYINSNLVGFANILDVCRRYAPRHLLYASSSSIYGANSTLPWSEADPAELPVSLYAATKKANELMAHSYSHITGIPMTGLRYFTVFGEWGRPDMAPYLFAKDILNGREITVYNNGKMSRDFTYADDAIEATCRLIEAIPSRGETGHDGTSPVAPHRVVNIGSGRPIALSDFIAAVEQAVGRPAKIRYAERAAGDVVDTFSDSRLLERLTGYRPVTPLDEGLGRLAKWLIDHPEF